MKEFINYVLRLFKNIKVIVMIAKMTVIIMDCILMEKVIKYNKNDNIE